MTDPVVITLAAVGGGRDELLARLQRNTIWTARPANARIPDVAADILVSIASTIANPLIADMIRPVIQDVLDMYLMVNGDRPLDDQAGDWDEGLDDQLQEAFEPYTKYLSQSWLGQYTIDCQLYKAGEVDEMSTRFAREVWNGLTFGRSERQICAGLGIVTEDLDAVCELPAGTTQPEPEKVETSPMAINAVLNLIILSSPSPDTLAEDLDMASDTDDGLALGAAQRLGISMDDVNIMRECRARDGKVVDNWQKAITDGTLIDEGTVYVDLDGRRPDEPTPEPAAPPPAQPANTSAAPPPPPPAAPAAAPPAAPQADNASAAPPPPPPAAPKVETTTEAPKGRGGKRQKQSETPPENYIPQDILAKVKDAGGLRDEDMARVLGVSRPSFNNMVNGKAWCDPSDDRRLALKTLVYEKLTALTEAYNSL